MIAHIVHTYYDVHTHNRSLHWALRNITLPIENRTILEEKNWYSVGWHPWYLQNVTNFDVWEELTYVCHLPQVLAIGETGLDRVRAVDFSLQQKIFEKHIVLSEEIQKPLIIHCVKAYYDVISFHKKYKPSQPWIIHGFQGNLSEAKEMQKKGMFLSFGDSLLSKNILQSTFKEVDGNYILIETDQSETPLEYIYHKAAELKNIDTQVLQNIVKRNLCNIFSEKYIK
jgi:TatD DNase family protein